VPPGAVKTRECLSNVGICESKPSFHNNNNKKKELQHQSTTVFFTLMLFQTHSLTFFLLRNNHQNVLLTMEIDGDQGHNKIICFKFYNTYLLKSYTVDSGPEICHSLIISP